MGPKVVRSTVLTAEEEVGNDQAFGLKVKLSFRAVFQAVVFSNTAEIAKIYVYSEGWDSVTQILPKNILHPCRPGWAEGRQEPLKFKRNFLQHKPRARQQGYTAKISDSDASIIWLGNLDSNQDRRSQSPLFYR